MNILAISDVHGAEQKGLYDYLSKNKMDLLIISGDITDFGPLEFVGDFLNKLSKYINILLAVPGNCDPVEVKNKIDESAAICIHEDVIEYGNVVMYGFGGSNPTPFDTPGEMDEDTLYNSIKKIIDSKSIESIKKPSENFPYGKVSILITHAPPKNTETDKISSGAHVGSESIRRIIKEYNPRINICGHIHEARAFDILDETTIINPGALSDGYGCLIEIDDNNNVIGNFVELK
ncbi:3',5'-cyclic adenosine monophosphate phosphodiesterase CpdA [Candidatus Methanobinarius endosymbioticus]|uniref:3',5'-cyclic adenosine monophosphate phosphodiesterase CpdA n=1 Tax=Candidatus Methanobinarius endosymbioticus TaxID=2006182 RepID=A0A366MDX9_9EURY|nr:3',5'-cyclic adenosine monophosphate phosphodiesterase CpdA [Candidatus Methanobinarius endosymbioticus]